MVRIADRKALHRSLALAAVFLCAASMAGCADSPRTSFDWGVNDGDMDIVPTPRRAPRQYASNTAKPKPRQQAQPQRKPAWYVDRSTADARDQQSPTASVRFVWPVQGRIISDYGTTANGQRNDGINIATQYGQPIRAAAGGTVTYAGNELKGYGNLVLIKHDDGYVTAYAHAQKLTVQRGARVGAGDVIGYAGDTGDVTSPQLHFEIRHGVKPVNPRPLLLASNS
jgi:murein DD-endopeptidase MepM/ murein hydrolase activator NlpD